jgi:hypothetical protein
MHVQAKKYAWFPIPIQVFIQLQWWSYLSTHFPQVKQWRESLVHKISQLGQRESGSKFLTKSRNGTVEEGRIKPGSVEQVRVNRANLTIKIVLNIGSHTL